MIKLALLPRYSLLLGISVTMLGAGAARASAPTLSTTRDFSLRDSHGTSVSLPDAQKAPILVLAFLGTECPLAKLYAPRLDHLARDYRDRGVHVVGVFSNDQDSLAEMGDIGKRQSLRFPLVKDPAHQLADAVDAERTPEVFVYDQARRLSYRGRIDDQFGIDYQRPHPTSDDLRLALDQLIAGKPPIVSRTMAVGCRIGRRPKATDHPTVTWSRDISRLMQRHCQECHRPGQVAPFSLLGYDDAAQWAAMIREVVSERRMPPWHADPSHGEFLNDARLSEEERKKLLTWIDEGAPRGNSADEPPPLAFSRNWAIPHPDQVVYMSEQPFTVPADGAVEYKWFRVDPGFTQDKWIKGVECRPGNPAVVHHVTVYFEPPGGDSLSLGKRINLVGGFAPGKRPTTVPWDGSAKFIPKGSTFLFEMHYTPNGVSQTDRSAVALLFANPAEVKTQLAVVLVANDQFTIPPRESNYQVESSYAIQEDSLLKAMSPHMHLRGKSFVFEALFPDGRSETLLSVPRFDFNWQLDYVPKKPIALPKGTVIHCLATFDNSEENRSNPDPDASVRWGEQTWEEMMIGAIVTVPEGQDLSRGIGPPLARPGGRRGRRIAAATALALASLASIALFFRRRSRNLPTTIVFENREHA